MAYVAIHQNPLEWIDTCCEATEAINEAKTESNLLHDGMSNSNGPNMWKVIQSLNGTLDANSTNDAMSHNGRTFTRIKTKANIFVDYYAKVSKLNMSKADRDLNRHFKKQLDTPSINKIKCCAPLQMGEFLSAIEKMKSKGVAGLEKIPLSFHKSLGPLALLKFLSIFNSSFSLAHCPRIWRVAIIIPLLADGKSSCEVASFYTNSLTFCVVKLFERILADRLDYIAEKKNLFAWSQARFRKGRSCKDQITQIVQAREDSFQQRPLQSSVLTLFDISKAYDTVWRKASA